MSELSYSTDPETALDVGCIILRQIGRAARAAIREAASFAIPDHCGGVRILRDVEGRHVVEVVLDFSDTYTVRAFEIADDSEPFNVREETGIHCDELAASVRRLALKH